MDVLPSTAAMGGGTAATALGALINTLDLGRSQPARNSVAKDMEKLGDAYDKHVQKIGSGRPTPSIDPRLNTPADGLAGYIDAARNSNTYASNNPTADGGYRIRINPNADSAYLAHELGHVAAQQTDVGKLISDIRHNPKLTNALVSGALLTVPAGTLAALNDGDDDMTASVLLSLAGASPTILDEVNASRHGLQIMDAAGMRGRLPGAAGRMAGGLMTYVGAPVIVGGAANLAGNQFDSEQTEATLMPD